MQRFPSFAGQPGDRLKRLNEKLEQLGWKGAALWVAPQMPGETWGAPKGFVQMGPYWHAPIAHQKVVQQAPAIISRNCPLPEVSAEAPKPYVVAAHNPAGAWSIATLPRRISGELLWPRAEITFGIGDGREPVGIFGLYRRLRLELTGRLGNRRVWAQDLAGEQAVDITDRIHVEDNAVVLEGQLLEQVGTSAGREHDPSAPGLVLRILEPSPA